ncbi:MAG TPA: M20 family metallopeptidase [Verrucomicrobiae bacterium]|jgi:glutamate carboxypeptidase|nr:M20 family metallopeptidase [Verrucomicrobiae bacterium]
MTSKKIAASTRPARSPWPERLRYFEQRLPELVRSIREFAQIESPSDHKPSADHMCSYLAKKFEALGGTARIHATKKFGNNLQIDFAGRGEAKPVLLLGHYDTVYPLGTLAKMPVRETDGRLHGPGVLDMKAGVALMWFAIEALKAWHGGLPRPVTVFLVSDEEVGSDSSRPMTEILARKSAAVLVLEPAAGTRGAVKTARKGVGDYTLTVEGIAAHAGLDPTKGHSAIVEIARQITAVAKLNHPASGLTLNPGVVRGGTRTNVIAAEASVDIDVRIKQAKQAVMIDRKLRALKPHDKHCKLSLEGGINRMPMERTAGVAALYKKAQAIGKEIGWKVEEAAVGGGSDGNFTAALGIPTLDGLGGVGEGAHAVHEHIVISELPRRALLVAALTENA